MPRTCGGAGRRVLCTSLLTVGVLSRLDACIGDVLCVSVRCPGVPFKHVLLISLLLSPSFKSKCRFNSVMGNLSTKKNGRARPKPPSPPPIVPAVEVAPPPETVHEHIFNRIIRHGKRVAQLNAETGEEVTFESIVQRSCALAAGLTARGLRYGDVAMVIGENSPHYPWVLLGIMQTGAAAHLINSKSTPRELEHAISISRPKMILVSAMKSEDDNVMAVLRGSTCVSQILTWGSETSNNDLFDGVPMLEQIMASPARSVSSCLSSGSVEVPAECAQVPVVPVAAVGPEVVAAPQAHPEGPGRQSPFVMVGERESAKGSQPVTPTSPIAIAMGCIEQIVGPGAVTRVNGETVCLLLSSSGSTGLPKAVMLTHNNILAALEQDSVFIDPDDIMLGLSPYSHAFGGILMMMGLTMGVRVVAMPLFSMPRLVNTVEKYAITVMHVVPSLLVALSKTPTISQDSDRMSSIQRIWTGAAQMSPLMQTEIKGRLPGVKMFHSYGMTETTFTVFTGEARPDKPGSPGKIMPGMRCKIIDLNTGEEVPGRNVRGELCFRGNMLMKGYLGNPEATKEAVDSEGWLHSGDLGCYDSEGYFYIMDRIKDILKFNGYQIAPSELEALLVTHPAVQDAAVIGVPHDYGDAPQALVVVSEGARVSEEDLKRYIAERLASHKHLRGGVIFVKSFPKTVSGKLQRKKLKALISDTLAATPSSSSRYAVDVSPTHTKTATPPAFMMSSSFRRASEVTPTNIRVDTPPSIKVDTLSGAQVQEAVAQVLAPPDAAAETPPPCPAGLDLAASEVIDTFHTPVGQNVPADGDQTMYGSPMVLCLTPATPPEIDSPEKEQQPEAVNEPKD